MLADPSIYRLGDLQSPVSPYVKKLRIRQRTILHFVYTYSQQHRHPPSMREVGKAAGISSTSVVNYNLKQLQAWGFINRTPGAKRTILLTEAGYRVIEKHAPHDLNTEVVRLLSENQMQRKHCQELERLCEAIGQGNETCTIPT